MAAREAMALAATASGRSDGGAVGVCCAAACGVCGGWDCSLRLGGWSECCVAGVIASKRWCGGEGDEVSAVPCLSVGVVVVADIGGVGGAGGREVASAEVEAPFLTEDDFDDMLR